MVVKVTKSNKEMTLQRFLFYISAKSYCSTNWCHSTKVKGVECVKLQQPQTYDDKSVVMILTIVSAGALRIVHAHPWGEVMYYKCIHAAKRVVM